MLALSSVLAIQPVGAKKKVEKVDAIGNKPRLATELDSASYAIGVEIGNDLVNNFKSLPNGSSLNRDAVLEAISAIFKNDTSSLIIKSKDARSVYQSYLQKMDQIEKQETLKKNQEFLANNKKNPSVVETASGLQYEILREGNAGAAKPTSNTDKVKVNYKGTLLDGTVFDSSYDRGTPAEFELNRVIPGWTEGIQLMSVGSKYKFYIPSQLAYGERANGKIKANSLLIFEVELLDVTKGTTPANNSKPATIGKYNFPKYEK